MIYRFEAPKEMRIYRRPYPKSDLLYTSEYIKEKERVSVSEKVFIVRCEDHLQPAFEIAGCGDYLLVQHISDELKALTLKWMRLQERLSPAISTRVAQIQVEADLLLELRKHVHQELFQVDADYEAVSRAYKRGLQLVSR